MWLQLKISTTRSTPYSYWQQFADYRDLFWHKLDFQQYQKYRISSRSARPNENRAIDFKKDTVLTKPRDP